MLATHEQLSKLDLNNTQMDFDATIVYPSAAWDKIETGFAFKPHMNDVYIETFTSQTFNQDGNESAILKIKYYNPPNLLFQL